MTKSYLFFTIYNVLHDAVCKSALFVYYFIEYCKKYFYHTYEEVTDVNFHL